MRKARIGKGRSPEFEPTEITTMSICSFISYRRDLLAALYVMALAVSHVPGQIEYETINPFGDKTTDDHDAPDLQQIVDKADELYESGGFGKAAKLYAEVLQFQPNYFPALLSRAKCLGALGEPRMALALVDQTLALVGQRAPETYREACEFKAELLANSGKFQEAIDCIEEAIKGDPTNANFLVLRASSIRNLVEASSDRHLSETGRERLQFALNSLERATGEDHPKPTREKVLFERGLIKLSLGRSEEAREDITSSLRVGGLNPDFAKRVARRLTVSAEPLVKRTRPLQAGK